MHVNDADGMANSVYSDQTAPFVPSTFVHVQIFEVFMVSITQLLSGPTKFLFK